MPRSSATAGRVVRIAGVVLTALVGIPFLLVTTLALSSRFGPASSDPHGYGLLFGTFLALATGLVLACVAPMMFRPGLRGTVYRWTLVGYVLVAAVLIISVLTA